MKSLIEIIKQISEKQGFTRNAASSPDSVWSRSSANRKVVKKKGGAGNDQQANGADIAKKMDFDVEPKKSVHDTQPLSMMDVVLSIWRSKGYDKKVKK